MRAFDNGRSLVDAHDRPDPEATGLLTIVGATPGPIFLFFYRSWRKTKKMKKMWLTATRTFDIRFDSIGYCRLYRQ
jgi:hypothetical protein